MLSYKYIDFVPKRFDWSICLRQPFANRFDMSASEHGDWARNQSFTDAERQTIIDESYYQIYGPLDYWQMKNIPIEDFSFSTVHGNSVETIKSYVKSYRGYLGILIGNNSYTPSTQTRLFKHAHLPLTTDGVTYKDTFTIIYPIHIEGEVTESMKVFFTDKCLGVPNLTAPLREPEVDVTTIDFPKQGQALLVHFNSCNGIHWVDGLTNNNFIAHAFDGVTINKQFYEETHPPFYYRAA